MIPLDYILQWRGQALWSDIAQIEQDLVISRALCDLFNHESLADKVALRGGTAIHKLLFQPPLRFSEDIDLVQLNPEPIGDTIDEIRDALAWLGDCKRRQSSHSTRLFFQFAPEISPNTTIRLKVEINTREHRNLYPIRQFPFEIDSGWYTAKTQISSFEPDELFATKLRALLQRNKSRDLFDLYEGIRQLPLDFDRLIFCFNHYLALEGKKISRADAEERMLNKLNSNLIEDITELLPAETQFDYETAIHAFNLIWGELIVRLDGKPWKLSDKIIDEARRTRIPNLLE